MTRDKFAISATPRFVSFSLDPAVMTSQATPELVPQDPPVTVKAPPLPPISSLVSAQTPGETTDTLIPQTSSPLEPIKAPPRAPLDTDESGDESHLESLCTDNFSTVER